MGLRSPLLRPWPTSTCRFGSSLVRVTLGYALEFVDDRGFASGIWFARGG